MNNKLARMSIQVNDEDTALYYKGQLYVTRGSAGAVRELMVPSKAKSMRVRLGGVIAAIGFASMGFWIDSTNQDLVMRGLKDNPYGAVVAFVIAGICVLIAYTAEGIVDEKILKNHLHTEFRGLFNGLTTAHRDALYWLVNNEDYTTFEVLLAFEIEETLQESFLPGEYEKIIEHIK